MKEVSREIYLNRLISKRENGMIKVITGIRRCGKSYLLDPLYKNYLLSEGVSEDHIIKIELDRATNRKYHHNAEEFEQYIYSLIKDEAMHYLILDEIQLVEGFELILSGLLYEKNLDVYVTGSNSKFLSTDLITEFRGRGDQIQMNSFSFSEYYSAVQGDKNKCWREYISYGGMPLLLSQKTDEEKSKYLKDLLQQVYFKDIVDRYKIKRLDVLDAITNILASSVGSLTNPKKVYDTFKSRGEKELSLNTVNAYLSYVEDSFIVRKACRYDLKGRKYISTPHKYYFSDMGLRNAKLNFRQQEESHLMENIIYNELVIRGYNVDVGVVEIRENNKRIQTEIDFVCNEGNKKYYIQSALNLDTREKTFQESRPLLLIEDSFKKIIIVKEDIKPWYTEEGILVMGIFDFLLNPSSLDL
ncbi:ATP-binding protein [Proteiniclasticum sp. BAD-10]|uniref:ATP-binding protein n=1 Tax=Proteiniclasticum sediminis TaxID=2804028 RepID=A0A941CNI6_9CLOT|nr:ATP-binding protein [Proteiniclasticum sediminis]MBR0575872.1 ATP-binding protein [Proteiniclasticum sediminis]